MASNKTTERHLLLLDIRVEKRECEERKVKGNQGKKRKGKGLTKHEVKRSPKGWCA